MSKQADPSIKEKQQIRLPNRLKVISNVDTDQLIEPEADLMLISMRLKQSNSKDRQNLPIFLVYARI